MHCVDLGESFPTHIYLQNLASIQPRTSPIISEVRALGNLNLNFEISNLLFAAQGTPGSGSESRVGKWVACRRQHALGLAEQRVGLLHGDCERPGFVRTFFSNYSQKIFS